MNVFDTFLPIVGVLVWLAILSVVAVAFYRRVRPYRVVGHSPSLGMVAIRWRDNPDRTHWLTPDHLAQQIGQHR